MSDKKMSIGGGYWLFRDSYCCWICQECVHEKGKHKGEKYLVRVSGYTATVEDALIGMIDRHTREIGAESINVLIGEIKSLKSGVRSWAKAIESEDK